VLGRYELTERVPLSVRYHLERGAAGLVPETPKQLPAGVENVIIGSNALALSAAQARAEELGYRVINLGPFVEGETRHVAVALAGVALSARRHGWPARPPLCLLAGGETTVTLGPNPGKGGRNQEFALAALLHLEQAAGLAGLAVLSGGTDGEDGPTDAAGAVADETTVRNARRLGLRPEAHLARHDAYAFFQEAGELLRTGLTHTNVMDVRVLLVT
jgi:hydroxypyruvate reductase/glycerate 2-kinase